MIIVQTILKTCRSSDEVQFYFLENDILHGCEHETILNVDDQVEITIKKKFWFINFHIDTTS